MLFQFLGVLMICLVIIIVCEAIENPGAGWGMDP